MNVQAPIRKLKAKQNKKLSGAQKFTAAIMAHVHVINKSPRTALERALRCECCATKTVKF